MRVLLNLSQPAMAYMEGNFNDIMRGDSMVRFCFAIEVIETRTSMVVQGGHNTGKTGNLDVDFSRQENTWNLVNLIFYTGKILKFCY